MLIEATVDKYSSCVMGFHVQTTWRTRQLIHCRSM